MNNPVEKNGSSMKFICNRKKFATLVEACEQAKKVWEKTGIFVAVESYHTVRQRQTITSHHALAKIGKHHD